MEAEDETEKQESIKQEYPANYYVWSSSGNETEDEGDNKDEEWGSGGESTEDKVLLRMKKKCRKIRITSSKRNFLHIIIIYVDQVVSFFVCFFLYLDVYQSCIYKCTQFILQCRAVGRKKIMTEAMSMKNYDRGNVRD